MKPEEELSLLFLSVGNEFKKKFSELDSKYICSHKDMRVLEFLYSGPKTMSNLSQEMELTPGSMTTAIDKLVVSKFVKRVYDKEDRRKVSVILLKKGLDIAQHMHNSSLDIAKNMLNVLSLNDQKEMIRLLETSINGIKNLKTK
jgi:DNA-binding MarR family transcriptional regulator